jgi:hypothetical protein
MDYVTLPVYIDGCKREKIGDIIIKEDLILCSSTNITWKLVPIFANDEVIKKIKYFRVET